MVIIVWIGIEYNENLVLNFLASVTHFFNILSWGHKWLLEQSLIRIFSNFPSWKFVCWLLWQDYRQLLK